MINYKPRHGDTEMWMIGVAVGENHDLINKMQKNEDGSYPVSFTVGGVELDFSKVAKRIDEQLVELVAEKSKLLFNEKCDYLIDELSDLQERIKKRKNVRKYEW